MRYTDALSPCYMQVSDLEQRVYLRWSTSGLEAQESWLPNQVFWSHASGTGNRGKGLLSSLGSCKVDHLAAFIQTAPAPLSNSLSCLGCQCSWSSWQCGRFPWTWTTWQDWVIRGSAALHDTTFIPPFFVQFTSPLLYLWWHSYWCRDLGPFASPHTFMWQYFH